MTLKAGWRVRKKGDTNASLCSSHWFELSTPDRRLRQPDNTRPSVAKGSIAFGSRAKPLSRTVYEHEKGCRVWVAETREKKRVQYEATKPCTGISQILAKAAIRHIGESSQNSVEREKAAFRLRTVYVLLGCELGEKLSKKGRPNAIRKGEWILQSAPRWTWKSFPAFICRAHASISWNATAGNLGAFDSKWWTSECCVATVESNAEASG